ncbi:YscO family type III secretion system apparatus protein [Pseudomonas entomophila]|uniref:type III secretion system stalk subunit SctO n=1 Tax=Pseudomonas entomophila TaxID=312306 RepID=UPI002404DF3B|nr:YscO family type III secretion system apparatus protein [Pseudomonas entomophila]MDF9618800.1 YscO family type III secretion system apparatus protein [Pseudomonas entomophila]
MPLTTLVRVKHIRLDKAEREARVQLECLQRAEQAHHQSVEAVNDYRDWRLNEEALLYLRHQDSLVSRKLLEQWQRQVAVMREKETGLEQAVDEHRRTLQKQQAIVRQCQEQLKNAQQQAEKFNQLQQEAFALQRLADETKEAAELDEFRYCTSET